MTEFSTYVLCGELLPTSVEEHLCARRKGVHASLDSLKTLFVWDWLGCPSTLWTIDVNLIQWCQKKRKRTSSSSIHAGRGKVRKNFGMKSNIVHTATLPMVTLDAVPPREVVARIDIVNERYILDRKKWKWSLYITA